MNLGWKLAAHVQGRAPSGLLDSHHTERHPVAARVLATTRAQGVLMSPPPDADDVRALREIVIDLARLPDANRYLTGLMSGLDLRYDLGDSDQTACWSDPTATSAGQARAQAHHPSPRCGDGSAPHRSDRPDPPQSSTPRD